MSFGNQIAQQQMGGLGTPGPMGPLMDRPAGHTSHRDMAPPIAGESEKMDTHSATHSAVHKHLHNALNAHSTPDKRGHVFRALSALNAIGRTPRKPAAAPMAAPTEPDGDDMGSGSIGGPPQRQGLMQALQSFHGGPR